MVGKTKLSEVKNYNISNKQRNSRKSSKRNGHVQDGHSDETVSCAEIPILSDQGAAYRFETSRFQLWQKVIKLRYWEDAGSSSEFNVEWKDVTDQSGTIVEYSAKVFRNNLDADSEVENTCLFRLTLYVTKNKIMIQGNYKDEWVMIDFPRLLNLVNVIENSGACDNESIVKAYGEMFNREVEFTDELDIVSTAVNSSNKDLFDTDIGGILNDACREPLPVSDSDLEIDSDYEIQNYGRGKSPDIVIRKPKSPKPSGSKLSKVNKNLEISSPKVSSENCSSKRIKSLEQNFITLEAKVANILIEQSLNNIDYESLINAKLDDIKTQLKSEFSARIKSLKDEMNDIKSNSASVNKENKSLQGKIATLSERNSSLQGSLNSCLTELSDVKSKISELTQLNEQQGKEILSLKSQLTESNAKCTVDTEPPQVSQISVAPSCPNPSEIQVFHTNESRSQDHSFRRFTDQRHRTEHRGQKFKTDVVILMDSNRRFIDKKRLKTRKGQEKISIIRCGTAEQATNIATDPLFEDPKVILMFTGTNDIETCSAVEVHNNLTTAATMFTDKFPACHIAISGVVRNDDDNHKCRELNSMLAQSSSSADHVFKYLPVDQLEDSSLFFDKKHFKRGEGVKRLAVHLKSGMMNGLGYKSTTNYSSMFSPVRNKVDRRSSIRTLRQPTYSDLIMDGSTTNHSGTAPGFDQGRKELPPTSHDHPLIARETQGQVISMPLSWRPPPLTPPIVQGNFSNNMLPPVSAPNMFHFIFNNWLLSQYARQCLSMPQPPMAPVAPGIPIAAS